MPDSATTTHALCRCARIRALNDQLRQQGDGGRIVMTRGVMSLGKANLLVALQLLAGFADFTLENDPHGEHDMGLFDTAGHTLLWKIDYYDVNLEYGSPDPADPTVTTRVLTLMLAEDY